MTTASVTSQSSPDEQKPGATRTRSPAYPSLNLQDAIQRAKTIWDKEKRNATPLEALASDWGLKAKSSTAVQTASTLNKYGLLEEVESGKDRLFKLSQVALNILLDEQSDSQERLNLLKQCALRPKIHAELWNKYHGDLPSDASLKRYLIVERKFNDAVVDSFIKSFRDTISFAKLSSSDKISTNESAENESDLEHISQTPVKAQEEPKVSQSLRDILGSNILFHNPISVVREFNFPLPAGVASLKIPFPLTEDDFQSLIKTLNTFKDGLVKTEIPVVDCSSAEWEQKAEVLAESKIEFNLLNFNYTHDIVFSQKLAKDHDLNLRIDPNKGIALFRKRPEKDK
jgi:hypothetical protein